MPRKHNSWWEAKSRGTSLMVQCQLNIFHIVLWLLISNRKSRPGQPYVRKYSRHCSCWQQWRRMEQSQAMQSYIKGQPMEQLNRKANIAKRACSQPCSPPQSLTIVPRGTAKNWIQSLLVQYISLSRISALSVCVVPFFKTTNTHFPKSHAQQTFLFVLYCTCTGTGSHSTSNALITRNNKKVHFAQWGVTFYVNEWWLIDKNFTWL